MKGNDRISPTGARLTRSRSLHALAAMVLAAAAAVAAVGAVPQAPASAQSGPFPMSVGIPAYFYPGGSNLAYWSQLRSGYPTVSTAIATGLGLGGTAPDGNYQAQISQTHATGVHVLAYVDTDGGARPSDVVTQEIDKAYAWYAVDGIFFDRAVTWPVTCDQASYYQGLSQYVKTKGGNAITALNHGQILPECYASAADVLVTAETTYDGYTAWQPWGWEQNYPAAKFWHMVHSTPTVTQMQDVVRLSRARNAGTVFVTSVDETNPSGPWGALPPDPYWSSELSTVSGGSTTSTSTSTTVAPSTTTSTTVAPSPTTSTTTPPPSTTVAPTSSPSIASFSPTSGPRGSTVTISGSGFRGLNAVTLNGSPVVIVSFTDSTIVVRLNSWNTTGQFSVRARGWFNTTSAGTFTVR